jgi:hypothetical protein
VGLFSKKPKVRFETITIDRESEVFRALENKGWILCDDPFQFDVHKSAEKLRKDAMSVAKGMHGELIVEIYDPIYANMPWKGLRYGVWRKATPDEIRERIVKQQAKHRPNYKDTMGSIEDIERKLDQKKIHVSEEDLHALDNIKVTDDSDLGGDSGGRISEELRDANEAIQAISTFDPYDHQGEMADQGTGTSGPVFEQSMEMRTEDTNVKDPTGNVDAMEMMMSAAESNPPSQTQQGQVPMKSPEAGTPTTTTPTPPPMEAPKAQPPANVPPSQPPASAAPPAGFKAPPPPPNSMVGRKVEDEK